MGWGKKTYENGFLVVLTGCTPRDSKKCTQIVAEQTTSPKLSDLGSFGGLEVYKDVLQMRVRW